MKHLLLFVIALLLTTLSQTTYAQTRLDTLVHDGVTRTYRVRIPPSLDTCEHVALVFNLHGSGSAGWQEELYTQFSKVADTARFITVYPDAVNAQWNVNGAGVDDVGFVQAMIDTLYAEFRIDRNRVYSCGMSMGGFMSYRLACELTDHIAAIASVTGAHSTVPCNPSRPIPVMQIHGTDDPTVPYSSVEPTINLWIQKNNCPDSAVVTQLPDINTTDSSTVTMSHYSPCDESTEIILYTVNGGGHTWPGAFGNIGITSRDMSASPVIWDFFKKYELSAYPAVTHCEWTAIDNPVSYEPLFNIHYISASQQLMVETDYEKDFNINVFDLEGRSRNAFNGINSGHVSLPCVFTTAGIYFYVASNKQGLLEKGKIVVY